MNVNWVENKFRSLAEIGGDHINYFIFWRVNKAKDPDISEKTPIIASPILFIFYYNSQTDTFEIKDEDMIFIKEEPANDETIYTYKVPNDLIGTWRSEDHMKTFDINEQTITVYDYNTDISKYTYDIAGFDRLRIETKSELINFNGNTLYYRLFWNMDTFKERYPNACLNNDFFVFYYGLKTQSIRTKDKNSYFTKE